jgi:hypothetical protein
VHIPRSIRLFPTLDLDELFYDLPIPAIEKIVDRLALRLEPQPRLALTRRGNTQIRDKPALRHPPPSCCYITVNEPQLAKAFQACRVFGAKLVIAKLDRLSRDAHFLLGLEKAGVDFVAADMPTANRLTVGIMAMVAEEERRMISARTKAALAAARARGVKLGGDRGTRLTAKARAKGREVQKTRARVRAADLSEIVKELQASGAVSLRAIAAGLAARGIPTARGGVWSSVHVMRLLERIGPFDVAAAGG